MSLSPRKVAVHTVRASRDAEKECRIAVALEELGNGEHASIAAAARANGIPATTLQHRHNGLLSRSASHTRQQKLTPAQEEMLVQQIKRMADHGFPMTPAELLRLATCYHRSNTSNPTAEVHRNWVTSFVARHPELTRSWSRCLDHARAHAANQGKISSFFTLFQSVIAEHNISSTNIYNMDETGFMLGQSSSRRVLIDRAVKSRGSAFRTQPGNRENITVIEAIGAGGVVPPPMIILKGKSQLHGWYRDDNLMPSSWHIAISESGWTSAETAVEWLKKCFEPYTRPSTASEYRLLLLDGHFSHITPEFVLEAWEHRIVPVCFPSHTTHLLQPLDVSIFGPLTSAYRQEVDNLGKHGAATISKQNFIDMYPRARKKTMTSRSARNAFKDVGLVPYNPQQVLQKLPGYREETPEREGTQPVITTPQSSREAVDLAASLRGAVSADRQQRSAFNKLVRSCVQVHDHNLILQQEIKELKLALGQRRTYTPGDSARLSLARVLSVEDAQKLMVKRQEDAQAKEDRAAARRSKALSAKKSKGKEKQTAEAAKPLQQPATAVAEPGTAVADIRESVSLATGSNVTLEGFCDAFLDSNNDWLDPSMFLA